MNKSQQRGTARKSQARRAELIATGRKLFAHTSYDALSMDDIARHAGVAKGLIYYYFANKRGYYLAVVEESVADLVARAASHPELPRAQRVQHTVDGYLHYARNHRAAYRTIVTGGVGSDVQVQAIRDSVRARLLATLAKGAYGRTDVPATARLALLGWMTAVEGITLDWISDPPSPHTDVPSQEEVRELLVGLLRATLETIASLVPQCPAPSLDDTVA
ncbi:TetR/AcrR family transcriptional regulator [Streptomyces sp. NBC_00237]|uniref:TetR/AcrR family transcriptional regulator n=1 Tax=Streptomyces sp. NBC_00237 TaxID=2975687 RepID=UPI0022595C81|nr:TetR/AcrR family transcriptional regulator [Streptomyces sp. NBC_00237]MCX5202631.1 TetR/AcrR family transcriptional regulator [Streptomyces sp. NBC_00237]